eukprot:scaffold1931_cov390-Prasinococcus_capsulatus_cf.AAC.10
MVRATGWRRPLCASGTDRHATGRASARHSGGRARISLADLPLRGQKRVDALVCGMHPWVMSLVQPENGCTCSGMSQLWYWGHFTSASEGAVRQPYNAEEWGTVHMPRQRTRRPLMGLPYLGEPLGLCLAANVAMSCGLGSRGGWKGSVGRRVGFANAMLQDRL